MARKPERKRKIKSIEASSRHQEENNKNYWSIKKKKMSCFWKLCWFLDKHKTWTKTTLNTCVKATLVQKPHQLFWPSILRKTKQNLQEFETIFISAVRGYLVVEQGFHNSKEKFASWMLKGTDRVRHLLMSSPTSFMWWKDLSQIYRLQITL